MRILRLAAALPLMLAAAPAPPFAPGQWEETLVFVLDSVNGSPELAGRMQGVLPASAPRRACLSAADVADPKSMLMDAGEGNCRFARFDMADGRLSAAGECTAPTGQTLHVEGSGAYTANGYDFSFTGTGRSGGLDMAFRGRDSGRRLGDCPAAG
jgi:hypothetical protein